MKRKALALTIILAILFLAVTVSQTAQLSSANFFPDPGPDLPRIYIRNDGSVEPSTAPIERTGNLYKLTGNIALYTIEIQRNNVVLDGAGHTIQGNANRIKGYDNGNNGVIIAGRKNVTITGLNFEQGDTGVRIANSSHITVVNNAFFNGTNRGVVVQDSTFVLIEANDFADIAHDYQSISLSGSENTVRRNKLTGSVYGIKIEGSSNVISDNKIESVLPIILDKADSNTISGNEISGPTPQSFTEGIFADPSRTGSEGIALYVDCTSNVIYGNNITGFSGQAIRTVFTCSNNTIFGNYMANNGFAVTLQEGALNNMFYGNTFAADSCKVHIDDGVTTFWDNGTIGNCWGDYNGTDSNGDGIGDAPYVIVAYKWDNDVGGDVSFVSGQDSYPLMSPYDFAHDTIVLPQTGLFIAVFVAIVVIAVGAGLLTYFKKRKREAGQA